MGQEERYDIVIIGGGHNGTTTAAYLSKCGLSVCVLEDRPECGGAQEEASPMAGVNIQPHAVGNFAAAAPGWEQLELWKYGFRMAPSMPVPDEIARETATEAGMLRANDKDTLGWAKISGMLGPKPFIKEMLRATLWCPPHPPEVELTPENIPFMQVYKERQPDMWTPELLEMSLFDLMDEHCETEVFKTIQAYTVWIAAGAMAHFEGIAIPGLAATVAITGYVPTMGGIRPRGGMHGYFHALFRCAVAHGVVFRTCCPVEEIIIRDGRAMGVRLRDDAAWSEKVIWADKAVLSATDIKATFLNMVGPKHLDPAFMQRIKDLSLKGGSLWQSHILTHERLRNRPGAFMGGRFDSRDIYFENIADIMTRQGSPTVPPEKLMWLVASGTGMHSPSHQQCTRPNQSFESSFCVYVTTPEYHVDGLYAMDNEKDKWNAYMREAFSTVYENLDSDNIIQHWANTPLEEEFRNSGMFGGSWYGIRECRDQWWNERPLPELARYRSPIEGLYLCHQSAGHPGGLCLMAIPYNLMHILIEDGIAEPGDWWYPSPWYIPQEGKISAIPR